MANIQAVLSFILIFGILVFFHELGHFLFAKLFKMKVEEFALGFGPKMVRLFHDGETEYTLRWLPLGGFVRIKGMEIEDSVEKKITGAGDAEAVTRNEDLPEPVASDPDGFNNRPIPQRFWVILGGPLFSFLLGWIALCLVAVIFGVADKPTTTIAEVLKGDPAAKAGIRRGDTVLSIDGQSVDSGEVMIERIRSSAGKMITLVVKNTAGTEVSVNVTPKKEVDATTGKEIGLIGIAPQFTIRRVGFVESIQLGTSSVGRWFNQLVGLFKTGAIKDNVGGPIAIFQNTQEASRIGGGAPLLLLGSLSLSLGLFNLFPIPVLDGGHLALMGLEALRRRKLTRDQTERVFTVGFAFVVILGVAVMFKDIWRLLGR